jgi:hypothetical protein
MSEALIGAVVVVVSVLVIIVLNRSLSTGD